MIETLVLTLAVVIMLLTAAAKGWALFRYSTREPDDDDSDEP
ncbi:hypothetical protein [Natronorubrum tibetense]|nr:hypothetical protein [Natronorubrum tibetense]